MDDTNEQHRNLCSMIDFLVELAFDGHEAGCLLGTIKDELYAQLDEWADRKVEGKEQLRRAIREARGWNEMLTAMHKVAGSINWTRRNDGDV